MPDWQTALQTSLSAWPRELTPWVAASVAVYILGTWLDRSFPRQWEPVSPSVLLWLTVRWLIRLVSLGGIPYMALLAGVASPRLMGLAEIDWVRGLGTAGAAILAGLALLTLGWGRYRASVPPPADTEGQPSWPLLLLRVAALQVHWAFYRNVTTLWLEDAYWGIWASLLLVGLESLAHPYLWNRHWPQGWKEGTVRGVGLLIVTTALFAATRNLWLCIIFHAVAEIATVRWLAVLPRSEPNPLAE